MAGGLVANVALAETASQSKNAKVSVDPVISITALDEYTMQISPTAEGSALQTVSGIATVATALR